MAPDAESNESCLPKRKQSCSASDVSEEKRLKKVATACDQCRKRKIKCNGETPCRRCHNLVLPCVYVANSAVQALSHSSDFRKLSSDVSNLNGQVKTMKDEVLQMRNSQLSSIQGRLEALEAEISAFKNDPSSSTIHSNRAPVAETPSNSESGGRIETWAPLLCRNQPSHSSSDRRKYRGPTSSSYDVDLAKSSLSRMGISGTDVEEEAVEADDSNQPSYLPLQKSAPLQNDPLYLLNLPTAMDAIDAYEDCCGLIYPLFDIQLVIRHVEFLYTAYREHVADLVAENPTLEKETGWVRLVLAIGCLLIGSGHENVGQALYAYMEPIVSIHMLRAPSLDSLVLLVLFATYLFHTDDEAAAWRVIGIAGRSCYELGLHRKEMLHQSFHNPEDFDLAVKMFWIVYALDRRWSFGAGIPFAIQDADVDETLPMPADDFPYLRHITQCNKIMSKIWVFNTEFDANNVGKRSDIGFLEFQVRQWYKNLPDSLKLDIDQVEDLASRRLYKIRLLLRLRANLAIIHVYRPILHSATNIHQHLIMARRAVDVARETIQLLVSVNQVSSVYRDQQVLYNYFLVQALAVIFLAISHAPAEFLNHTRKEFFEVLDLVKGFSMKSSASRQLWNTIQELKRLRDQIRRLDRTNSFSDNKPSDSIPPLTNVQQSSQPEGTMLPRKPSLQNTARSGSGMEGMQMSDDLLTFFEGLGDASLSALTHVGGQVGSLPPTQHPLQQPQPGGSGVEVSANAATTPVQIDSLPGLGGDKDGFVSIWTELL